jgi:hypothetical protein
MRIGRPLVLFIALAAATAALFMSPAGASGTRTVSLSTTAPTVTEGDAAVVTVSLTGAPATSDVIVNLKTVDGTAKAGSDYIALNTSVRFHPGDQTPKTVPVLTYRDNNKEGNETFSVTITGVRNASVATKTVVFTLTDYIQPPTPFNCQVWKTNGTLDWRFPPVAGATTYDLAITSDATAAVSQVTIPASAAVIDDTEPGDVVYIGGDPAFVAAGGNYFHGTVDTVVNGVATHYAAMCATSAPCRRH